MMGLAHLVESTLGLPTRLTRDGPIFRAENRAMVELLDVDLCSTDDLDWKRGEAVVMVDSQPNTGRHTFGTDIPIYAVIDHHQTPGDLDDVRFIDVRAGVGATCSIVTEYLMEQEVDLPAVLATGLLYGIETELNGVPREASDLDDDAFSSSIPLRTRIYWPAFAMPRCRRPTTSVSCRHCKAVSSTTTC
jgi:nanoRNase/pAp phosphatase (c-di-AMP/oligoRNAs hydrolase)